VWLHKYTRFRYNAHIFINTKAIHMFEVCCYSRYTFYCCLFDIVVFIGAAIAIDATAYDTVPYFDILFYRY
jgi:hypothetical protein